MPRTLKYLIKASGYSGVSGQSFRSHVTGAASGTHMTWYNCTGWGTWTGLPDPETVSFASGHTFNFGFTFVEGPTARLIRNTGSGIISVTHGGDTGFGQAFSASTSTSSGSSDGTVALTITSRVNPDAATEPINQVDAWFDGYASPATPGVGAQTIRFVVGTDYGAGSGIQYVDIVLAITGPIDPGPYNDNDGVSFVKNIDDIPMADRAATNSDLDVQWSEDGSSVTGTGLVYYYNQTTWPQDKLMYYRSRIIGASSYTSWHTWTFFDPREPE